MNFIFEDFVYKVRTYQIYNNSKPEVHVSHYIVLLVCVFPSISTKSDGLVHTGHCVKLTFMVVSWCYVYTGLSTQLQIMS